MLLKILEVKTMFSSLAEKHYVEGFIKGFIKGKAKTVIGILTHRFGKLPEKLRRKIMRVKSLQEIINLSEFAWSCVSIDKFANGF
ncbi:MAG: hypothetical protein LBL39_04370 [Planctomycetaceae bacterium]|nr:hypothetical protein [Planctomycetaceae bacterium]